MRLSGTIMGMKSTTTGSKVLLAGFNVVVEPAYFVLEQVMTDQLKDRETFKWMTI